jgi:hypothetical protein
MVCCVTSAAGSAEAARSTRQNHMLRCTSRFLNGDSNPMMEVWSHEPDVTAMHAAAGRQVG